MKPYVFVNEITYGKDASLMNDETIRFYSPYVVNRTLSYHENLVHLANVMNQYHFLDKDMQFVFLINTIRKGKLGYRKWIKTEKLSSIEVIKEYYGYSNEKARQVLKLLPPEQIKILKEKVYKGGRK